jgi:hypothetical protein
MFVRFRHVYRRLVINVERTHRVNGRARGFHIARVGSCLLPEPIFAAERLRFWREVEEKFRNDPRLAGLSSADRDKALAVIEARVPRPSSAEIALLAQLERLAA